MELKHYLNNIEIDEPIGFDNLKMTMKRGEYHGMSAEVSELSLEFYGAAADIVRTAYHTDLDTEVAYTVTADGEEMYHGVLDLSTYEEQSSAYCSVSCKVGEVGVKTTFNNRAETEVAINGENGIDGNTIVAPTIQTASVDSIPIIYSNIWKSGKDLSYNKTSSIHRFQPVFKTVLNEFGEHKLGETDEIVDKVSDKNIIPIFSIDSSDYSPYDVNLTMKVDIISLDNNIQDLRVWLQSDKKTENMIIASNVQDQDRVYDISIDLKGCTGDLLVYFTGGGVERETGEDEQGDPIIQKVNTSISLTILKGATLNVRYTSKRDDIRVKTKCVFIQDVIDCICQKIAGIRVKSDWYKVDTKNNVYGGGGLRAVTNGYCLRNAEGNLMFNRPIKLCFKDVIEALNAIDCVGYAFEEKNGSIVLSVERWNYFYRTEIILDIKNPNDIRTTLDSDLICSSLEIGYQKYVTVGDINAIDSVHAEYTFSSTLNAVKHTFSAKSKWIADQYAIELTRRQAENRSSADWKYDTNIFILEVWRCKTGNRFDNRIIAGGADIDGMLVDRIINPSLSVRRNAERWRDYMFFANKNTAFSFVSGEGNYNAAYRNNTPLALLITTNGVYRPADTVGGVISPSSSTQQEKYKENDTLSQKPRLLKAETLSFTYPLTIAQYKAIKANPYGLIEVDGIQGWIKEFTYSFADGEATFKLIPKAD